MAAEGLDIAGADTAAILERAIQNIPAFRKEYPPGRSLPGGAEVPAGIINDILTPY